MVIASAGLRVMALRAAGLLAAGAALARVVGDLALYYTPNHGDLLASDYRYFVRIRERWLLLVTTWASSRRPAGHFNPCRADRTYKRSADCPGSRRPRKAGSTYDTDR